MLWTCKVNKQRAAGSAHGVNDVQPWACFRPDAVTELRCVQRADDGWGKQAFLRCIKVGCMKDVVGAKIAFPADLPVRGWQVWGAMTAAAAARTKLPTGSTAARRSASRSRPRAAACALRSACSTARLLPRSPCPPRCSRTSQPPHRSRQRISSSSSCRHRRPHHLPLQGSCWARPLRWQGGRSARLLA